MANTFKHQKTYDLDEDDYPYHTKRDEKKKVKILARKARKQSKTREQDEHLPENDETRRYDWRNDP